MYEVNLTDSTGSLTPLSGFYTNPECLSIGPALYPDLCGPFQLSVAAISKVERSAVQYQTVLPDNGIPHAYSYGCACTVADLDPTPYNYNLFSENGSINIYNYA